MTKGIKDLHEEATQRITDQLRRASLNWDADLMRVINLTEDTDDPGNTELYIVLIPFGEYDEEEAHARPLQEDIKQILEGEHFTSEGDHVEEVLITTQNNEFLIIINRIK